MGKGGGCIFSKKRSAIEASDQDLADPVRDAPLRNQIENSLFQEESKKLKVFIVFYSMYGHVECLAKRMKKGVDSIDGVEGFLYRVPETLPMDVLEQMRVPQKEDELPFVSVDDLVEADGLLFGFPTRFGSMASQMKAFFRFYGTLVGATEACRCARWFLCEHRDTRRRPGDDRVDCHHTVSSPWDGLCSYWLHFWFWNVQNGFNQRRIPIRCRCLFR
ncbi:hypothetical protein V6Z11_A03G210600 [Gossypium hirsutum]